MVMESRSTCVDCGKPIVRGCVREIFDDWCDECNPFKALDRDEGGMEPPCGCSCRILIGSDNQAPPTKSSCTHCQLLAWLG